MEDATRTGLVSVQYALRRIQTIATGTGPSDVDAVVEALGSIHNYAGLANCALTACIEAIGREEHDAEGQRLERLAEKLQERAERYDEPDDDPGIEQWSRGVAAATRWALEDTRVQLALDETER